MTNKWYESQETYSGASRCPICPGRAVLTEEGAGRLVVASSGRLAHYPCPAGPGCGWHVWAPSIETTTTR